MFRCRRREAIKCEDFQLITRNQIKYDQTKVNSSDVVLRDFVRAHAFHTVLSHHFVKDFETLPCILRTTATNVSSLVSSGRLSGRDLFGRKGVRRLGGGGGDGLRQGNRKAAGRYECRVSAGEQWNALAT